jgi:hypothetical protein
VAEAAFFLGPPKLKFLAVQFDLGSSRTKHSEEDWQTKGVVLFIIPPKDPSIRKVVFVNLPGLHKNFTKTTDYTEINCFDFIVSTIKT